MVNLQAMISQELLLRLNVAESRNVSVAPDPVAGIVLTEDRLRRLSETLNLPNDLSLREVRVTRT
jgi:hypothetical protein